jgi:hypothetical protein
MPVDRAAAMMTNLAVRLHARTTGNALGMRKSVLVLGVCGAAASIVTAVAWPRVASRPAPSLRIAVTRPLTVTGRNFRQRERVRVRATVGGEKRTLAVTAGETGRFRVNFDQLGASRCDSIRIIAVRRSGRLVVVKRLPAPACAPA